MHCALRGLNATGSSPVGIRSMDIAAHLEQMCWEIPSSWPAFLASKEFSLYSQGSYIQTLHEDQREEGLHRIISKRFLRLINSVLNSQLISISCCLFISLTTVKHTKYIQVKHACSIYETYHNISLISQQVQWTSHNEMVTFNAY